MSGCLLNDDIWYHILRYLSSEDLQRANSCHHVLFEGWMRSRYTSVKFTSRDKAIRLLEHLCNPYVAAYVKKVEIRPWLVQSPNPNESSNARLSHILQPYHTRKRAKERLHRRMNEDVSKVNAAFKQMENVEEYNIDWDNSFRYHPELYAACLISGLDAWSEGLVKLTVKVPPAMLNSFARINLPKLESFHFQFSTGSLTFKEINVTHDGFIVFLNNLKDSLQSLAFSSTHSSQDLDLSRIFRKMGSFPSLSKVALSIPADGSHLSDPATFVRFLEKHRPTLEEINLLSSQIPCPDKPDNYGAIIDWRNRISGSVLSTARGFDSSLQRLPSPFDVLGRFMNQHHLTLKKMNLFSTRTTSLNKACDNNYTNWIQRVAGSICAPFPLLRAIAISLCPPGAPLENLVRFIGMHSSTLDFVALSDCTLSHNDVVSLFQFSATETGPPVRIANLQLPVEDLSSDLLVDLAFLLLNLKTLQIDCNKVSNSDSTSQSDVSDIMIDLFANDTLRSGWGLQHLKILIPDGSPGGVQTLTIDLSEGAPDHSFARPHSLLKSSSVSSLSSFATAKDTMLSLTSRSVSSGIHSMVSDISVYSAASSRTNETDYGRFYRRMALSQASIECDGKSWRSPDHNDARRTSWNARVAVD